MFENSKQIGGKRFSGKNKPFYFQQCREVSKEISKLDFWKYREANHTTWKLLFYTFAHDRAFSSHNTYEGQLEPCTLHRWETYPRENWANGRFSSRDLNWVRTTCSMQYATLATFRSGGVRDLSATFQIRFIYFPISYRQPPLPPVSNRKEWGPEDC